MHLATPIADSGGPFSAKRLLPADQRGCSDLLLLPTGPYRNVDLNRPNRAVCLPLAVGRKAGVFSRSGKVPFVGVSAMVRTRNGSLANSRGGFQVACTSVVGPTPHWIVNLKETIIKIPIERDQGNRPRPVTPLFRRSQGVSHPRPPHRFESRPMNSLWRPMRSPSIDGVSPNVYAPNRFGA